MARLYPDPSAFGDVRRRIAAALDADGHFRRQTRLVRLDGTPVWVDLFAVRLGGGRTYAILSDITPMRQAEEARLRAAELEAMNLSLAESARLKSQFLATMSHELRTPLNAVIGYAHLLQRASTWQDEARCGRYVQQIHDSGQHLLQLVENLLGLARADADRPRTAPVPLRIGTAIQEVADLVQARQGSHGVAIAVQVADGLDTTVQDPVLLRQLLMGLLDNAVKFSPPDGRVQVRAQAPDAQTLCIEVEDHGPGIPPQDLARLFQPFTQLSEGSTRSHGGVGLGLALVRQTARGLGGDVAVRSSVGAGSVFTLTLPLVLAADPPQAPG